MVRPIPSVLKKSDVLYGAKTPVEDLLAYGEAYLEAGDAAVALDFFEQAARRETSDGGRLRLSRKGLEAIKGAVLEAGDAFGLQRVSRAAPEMVSERDWETLIASARRLGKDSFAAMAERILRPPEADAEEAGKAAPGTESVQ